MISAIKCVMMIAGLICLVQSVPIDFQDDMQDSAVVESTIREVRAAEPDLEEAPTSYHKTYGDDDDNEKGYARKKSDKGQTGYQKFDSFHKKSGDSYGYEKHDSFGLKDKKKSDDESSNSHDESQNDESVNHEASPDDSGSYEVVENGEESDEGSDDGGYYYDGEAASESEGDIVPTGYDESDSINYSLPSEYSYGSGSDYDF